MVLAGKIHDSKSQFVLYPQMHHFHSMRTQEPPEFFHTLLMHGCKGKLVINILSEVWFTHIRKASNINNKLLKNTEETHSRRGW